LDIRWRDFTKRGLTAFANQTLDERVLDLLSDIMFASDEIELMVSTECDDVPFPGFYTALYRIYSEAASMMGKVVAPERKTPREH
jgi:hypothetical protein